MSNEEKSYLFIDESGDHSLDVIDPQYPMFVLGGVLISAADYDLIDTRWKQMKEDVFGSDSTIVHTADMTRNRKGFERMKESVFRQRAYSALNNAMSELPHQVICCAIKKELHLNRYGIEAIDPYHLSLNILVERAFFAIGKKGTLHIIAESRKPDWDRILETVFLEIKVKGTHYISATKLNSIEIELHIRDKNANITGLQMADLVVSPVGRFVLGKKMHEDWEIIKRNFYRYRGSYEGAGLVVLPK